MTKPIPIREALEPVNPTGPHVAQAIAAITAVMAERGISKTRKNQQQGFMFRGVDDVYAALGGVIAENQLAVLPRVLARSCEQRVTTKGNAYYSVVLDVEYQFISGIDGSMASAVVAGEAMDSGDKATNKALSAAYKYMAFQVFHIPVEGQDNDADAHTPDPAQAGHAAGPRNLPKHPSRGPAAHSLESLRRAIDTCHSLDELDDWAAWYKAEARPTLAEQDRAKVEAYGKARRVALTSPADEVFPGDRP